MSTESKKSKSSSSVRLWDETIKLVEDLVIDAAFYERGKKFTSVEMYHKFVVEGEAKYRRKLDRLKATATV